MKKQKLNQKGAVDIMLVILLVVVAVVGYFVYTRVVETSDMVNKSAADSVAASESLASGGSEEAKTDADTDLPNEDEVVSGEAENRETAYGYTFISEDDWRIELDGQNSGTIYNYGEDEVENVNVFPDAGYKLQFTIYSLDTDTSFSQYLETAQTETEGDDITIGVKKARIVKSDNSTNGLASAYHAELGEGDFINVQPFGNYSNELVEDFIASFEEVETPL